VSRIVTSVEAYDRVLEYADSEYSGVAFSQGNFAAMGVDIPETIRHFGERLHFAHVRDVEGDPTDFTETWHDDGSTDMAAAIDAYRDIGFDGVIRQTTWDRWWVRTSATGGTRVGCSPSGT
jgi:mannonate dehydratase